MHLPLIPAPTAEAELLRCSARVRLTPSWIARMRGLVGGELDWAAFLRMAMAQRVYPAAHASLLAVGLDAVPPAVRGSLEDRVKAHQRRSLMRVLELRRLVDSLHSRGLRVLPLKGPVLAHVAYGGVARRTYNDLDLLVDPGDFREVGGLLRTEGYEPGLPAAGGRAALRVRLEGSAPFRHEEYGFALDLHTRVAPRRYSYPLTFDELWERSEEVVLDQAGAGLRTRSLAAPDLLEFLCWHGTKHHWTLLKLVCDVAELVESAPALDWDVVLRRARDARVRRPLYLGLRLAHGVRSTALPPDVLREVEREGWIGPLAVDLAARFFDERVEPVGYLQGHLFHLRMRAGVAGKLRYVSSTIAFNKISRRLLISGNLKK